MKIFALALLLTVGVSIASAQTPTPAPVTQVSTAYVRPDASTRRNRYLKDVFGPTALAKYAITAGVGTARNEPEEWGGQWKGFGKRYASDAGRGLIRGTVTYGLDEALKLDSHFYRSQNRSTGAKLKNALISPFTARRPNGKRTIGIPRIVGTYSAGVIAAETWYPNRYTYKDGLKSGTISLGTNMLFNLVREFIKK